MSQRNVRDEPVEEFATGGAGGSGGIGGSVRTASDSELTPLAPPTFTAATEKAYKVDPFNPFTVQISDPNIRGQLTKPLSTSTN
jgi:hypothetical protein